MRTAPCSSEDQAFGDATRNMDVGTIASIMADPAISRDDSPLVRHAKKCLAASAAAAGVSYVDQGIHHRA